MRFSSRCMAAAGLLACAPGPAVWAQAERAPGLTVPSRYGSVLEAHPAGGPGRPTIVHIQDAHAGYEGQQNLIAILEQLISEDGLRLIFVEGGQGDVSLSHLRSYGPPEDRKAIAEQYLKDGRISGEEYLDLTSDHTLTLWGVEEPDLYRQNISAFQEAGELEQMVGPALADVRETVEQLRVRLLGQGAGELDHKRARFRERRLSLAEFASYLERLAKAQRVSTQPYPRLRQFADLQRLEASVELDDIPGEQRALIERLSARASAHAISRILTLAEGLRTGEASPHVFYGELKELAREQRIRLKTYPSLSRYIDYITLRAEMDMNALSGELEALANALREHHDNAPGAADLRAVDGELELIERLVSLRLTPDEYARLRSLNLSGLFSRWSKVLNGQLRDAGLPAKSFGRLSLVEAGMPTLEKCYDVSRRRDAALVENSLAKLKATQASVAVLITGGLHSPAITETLKARGIGLVVIAPTVTQ